MSGWFIFFLTVHILAVIVAFGPTFAFPMIGAMSAKHPESALILTEVTEVIEKRMTIPLAIVVPLAGTGLIYTGHVDLWHSEWLIAAIVIYAAAFFFAVLVQAPTGSKLIQTMKSMPPPPAGGPPPGEGAPAGPPPAIAALVKRLQIGGMALSFAIVTVLILMVWKPGNG
jgi:hypothetical protein